jgi:hypothetical protein
MLNKCAFRHKIPVEKYQKQNLPSHTEQANCIYLFYRHFFPTGNNYRLINNITYKH